MSLVVTGTGQPDNESGMVLYYGNKKIVIDCPEGWQRIVTQHKIRLKKIDTIILTDLHWRNIGGLPGGLLSLADSGLTAAKVFGPRNLKHVVAAMRHFVQRDRFNVDFIELSHNCELLRDENLNIQCAIIKPEEQTSSSSSSNQSESEINLSLTAREDFLLSKMFGPDAVREEYALRGNIDVEEEAEGETDHENNEGEGHHHPSGEGEESQEQLQGRKRRKKNKQQPGSEKMAPTMYHREAICLVVEMAPRPGKFDSERAKALQIPKGPLYAKLVKGETVELEDGRIIRPEDCVGPKKPGMKIFVIRCPSVDHIKDLVEGEIWTKYFEVEMSALSNDFGGYCVVHQVPIEILRDERYSRWMKRFGALAEHIILCRELCQQRFVFPSPAITQTILNSIDPFVFPAAWRRDLPACNFDFDQGLKTTKGHLLLQYNFILKLGFDVFLDQGTDEDKILKAALDDMRENDGYKIVKERFSGIQEDKPLEKGDWRVTFLGTGASLPSKYRNVSSTIVEIIGYGSLLFDCGEGTYGQMYRRFGHQGLERLISGDLKVIFISHLHADHHLGLVMILTARHRAQGASVVGEAITIVGPKLLELWLEEYSSCEPLGNYHFVDCEQFINSPEHAQEQSIPMNRPESFTSLGLTGVQAAEVIHCFQSYGFSVSHAKGWTIVYSGDTRPCDSLIDIGLDCDLLLHEATFEDEMKQEAVDKKHSTLEEGLDVARRMRAKFVMFSHFSQRYPKFPNIEGYSEEELTFGLAFDLMSVTQAQLKRVPYFSPLLREMFKEEEEDEEEESKGKGKEIERKQRGKGRQA